MCLNNILVCSHYRNIRLPFNRIQSPQKDSYMPCKALAHTHKLLSGNLPTMYPSSSSGKILWTNSSQTPADSMEAQSAGRTCWSTMRISNQKFCSKRFLRISAEIAGVRLSVFPSITETSRQKTECGRSPTWTLGPKIFVWTFFDDSPQLEPCFCFDFSDVLLPFPFWLGCDVESSSAHEASTRFISFKKQYRKSHQCWVCGAGAGELLRDVNDWSHWLHEINQASVKALQFVPFIKSQGSGNW